MGVLFISHSSQDNDQAIKVRDWLRSNGWGEVFLDLDSAHGLAPGQRWQEELKRAGENCSAVVVLLSPNWVASRWCQTEFLVADQLGKRIFPVFIAPTSFDDLPLELKAKFQLADISTPEKEAEGFQRLAMGLKRAGLDPKSFDWPPPGEPARSVYRGLQALDVHDAAIFFGRDAHITQGLDELRRLRDGAPKRIMVILGASGAGKSSFLRAGLIARLKRDEENFLVLPIVRPERAAITGAQGLNASISAALGRSTILNSAEDLAQAFAQARAPVVERLQRQAQAARETHSAKPPTIVLPLDQGEELFGAENAERASFSSLLVSALALDGNALVIVTIRSDSYVPLQIEPRLASAGQSLFNLPPIAAGSFQEIIEGPARLAKPPIVVEPALTQRLLVDLNAADTLPLLAFTLERLQMRFGGNDRLTVENYRDHLGGISGAIESAVAAAIGASASKEKLRRVRHLILPALVRVDKEGVKRRVARPKDFRSESWELAEQFIEQRLITKNDDQIELAHDAILRHWPLLVSWIEEDRGALVSLNGLQNAAEDWVRRSEDTDENNWLVHRDQRREDADKLCTLPHIQPLISDEIKSYLARCRALDERQHSVSTRARKIERRAFAFLSTVFFAMLILAGISGTTFLVERAERDRLLQSQLEDLGLQSYNQGDHIKAIRYLLAADRRTFFGSWSGAVSTDLLRAALRQTSLHLNVFGDFNDFTVSPDGRYVLAAQSNYVQLFNIEDPEPIKFSVPCDADVEDNSNAIQPAFVGIRYFNDDCLVTAVKFSPDGQRWFARNGTGLYASSVEQHAPELVLRFDNSYCSGRIKMDEHDRCSKQEIFIAPKGELIGILSEEGRFLAGANPEDGWIDLWPARPHQLGYREKIIWSEFDQLSGLKVWSDRGRYITFNLSEKPSEVWAAECSSEILCFARAGLSSDNDQSLISVCARTEAGRKITLVARDHPSRSVGNSVRVETCGGPDEVVHAALYQGNVLYLGLRNLLLLDTLREHDQNWIVSPFDPSTWTLVSLPSDKSESSSNLWANCGTASALDWMGTRSVSWCTDNWVAGAAARETLAVHNQDTIELWQWPEEYSFSDLSSFQSLAGRNPFSILRINPLECKRGLNRIQKMSFAADDRYIIVNTGCSIEVHRTSPNRRTDQHQRWSLPRRYRAGLPDNRADDPLFDVSWYEKLPRDEAEWRGVRSIACETPIVSGLAWTWTDLEHSTVREAIRRWGTNPCDKVAARPWMRLDLKYQKSLLAMNSLNSSEVVTSELSPERRALYNDAFAVQSLWQFWLNEPTWKSVWIVMQLFFVGSVILLPFTWRRATAITRVLLGIREAPKKSSKGPLSDA